MKWVEVSIEVEAEVAEAVAEVLGRHAQNGVVIESGPHGHGFGPATVRAYIPRDGRAGAKEQAIREGLWHLGRITPIPEPVFSPIRETDWTVAWREKLRVLHVGRHLVVRPSWRNYDPGPDEVVIELDPGQAFGTGIHPSTQLCLGALEELLQPGARVLDVGTGSGILAIAAAKLGAAHVLAVDTDPVAVEVARENTAKNWVTDSVVVVEGSADRAGRGYDLVVVNILLGTILELIEGGIGERANPGGHVVFAGILMSQADDVVRAAHTAGLFAAGRWASDEWIGLAFARAP